MSKPSYYLRARHYPENVNFVSIWLCRKDGDSHSGLLYGDVIPTLVDQIAAATGLSVEWENQSLQKPEVKQPGCIPVSTQKDLFS